MCRHWIVFSLAAALFASAAPADPLTPEQFKSLHALILPHPDELAWAQIPWLSDLWEARRSGVEKGKPIFLWEMDGHPLGCT